MDQPADTPQRRRGTRVQTHPDLCSVAVDGSEVVVRRGRHGAHVLDPLSAEVLGLLDAPTRSTT